MARLRAAGLALRLVVSLLVAVLVAMPVRRAAGRVRRPRPLRVDLGGGYELVGGCLEPGDIVVPTTARPHPRAGERRAHPRLRSGRS